MIVVAVDPGTRNLGWCMMEGDEYLSIVDAGVDDIDNLQKPIIPNLTRGATAWFEKHISMFKLADRVLIEQQFTGPGKGLFTPILVMQTIFVLCSYHFPDKVHLISPSAVKKTFQVVGTYEERKAQVVRMAGLQNLKGRVHDMADCVLMIEYDRRRSCKALVESERRAKNEERRKQLRESIPISPTEPPLKVPRYVPPPRDASPVRSSESDRTPSPGPIPTCKMCNGKLGARRYKTRVPSGGYDCHKCYLRRRRNKL